MPKTYGRPQHTSLFVKYLPDGAKAEELKSLFGKYGRISDVYIPQDYYTRRPRGFAYIQRIHFQFDDPRDAEDALDEMQGVRYGGCELFLEMARSDRKSPGTMRARERTEGGRSVSRSPRRSRYSRDDGYDEDYDRRRRRRDRSSSRSPPRRYRSSRSPVRRRRSRSRSGDRREKSRRGRSESRD